MSKNSESLNRSLYNLLRGKGYKPKMLDTAGKATPVPEEASVFIFNFVKDGTDYGQVSASVDGAKKLIVYYDDEVADSPNTNTSGTQVSDSWSTLVQHLSQWRFRNGLRSFELKNQDHLEPDMAQREYMRKKESVTEGYHPMGRQASYNDNIPNAKIIIQHSRKIEEGEQRYRNIARIFVENASGERFLIPTTKPGIAQVYARHIAEGGTPYDDRAQHINSLVEEHTKMAGFVRATRNGQFNESTQRLVQEGVNHYHSLRECLSKMRGHRGYQTYFESWTPPLMEDELDESNINELFVQETMDPRIESALPILSKLQKNISETTTMKEVDQLAEWADSLLEGGDGGEASEEEDIDTDGAAGEGTAEDVEDDENITEGMLDGSGEIDSPVANAITRRILMQRIDLLSKYGPEAVANAIGTISDDMGDWIGPDDEIGSSDVSAWVKRVEQELGGLAEGEPGDLEHELERQDYEQDSERDRLADLSKINTKTLQSLHALHRHYGQKDPRSKEAAGRGAEELKKRGIVVPTDESVEEGFGDVAKKVGSALKTGAKAVGKAIVGPDDDELLQNLKKAAGVRNPQTGKPSMAHSDVEKVDEATSYDGSEPLNLNTGPSVNDVFKRALYIYDYEGYSNDGDYSEDDAIDQYVVRKFGQNVLDQLNKARYQSYFGREDGRGTGATRSSNLGMAGSKPGNFRTTKSGKMHGQDAKTTKARVADRLGRHPEPMLPEGEFAGDYATGEAGQWRNKGPKANKPATIGDLVGESQLSEMDSEGYKGTRDDGDSKGPEGKATPIKAKDMAKDAEKKLEKHMDQAHKKDVKEGQEDLDAILRIIKK